MGAVILLFPGTVWATIIPSVTIPLTLLGTLGTIYLRGFSPDNLSLKRLTVAVGFVVDAALVMPEDRAGSELRKPLGFVMVGGLVASQVLTLHTMPVVYFDLGRIRRRLLGYPASGIPKLAAMMTGPGGDGNDWPAPGGGRSASCRRKAPACCDAVPASIRNMPASASTDPKRAFISRCSTRQGSSRPHMVAGIGG